MSSMKHGFSTLNRWLGKKNKDKSAQPNGKLSKSSTNLSVSTTNINDTSQLEYNRITPLPVVTSNAPFEQTFRITVLLPKDQLYVARLGARVPLSTLLELVCDNKQLDAEKYEFRNPVDASQVYSNDLTIGAVGLSEVRLCHKSDSYTNYNNDEVIKLHRTSLIRDSLSSSEFSSRNSKHTLKTASPYSSSNSLNSMDSSGVNYTRASRANSTQPMQPPTKMVAPPPRKKKAAPRPPSQLMIPEKEALVIENGGNKEQKLQNQYEELKLPRKDNHYMSTPNLAGPALLNGNHNNNNAVAQIHDENRNIETTTTTTTTLTTTNGHVYDEHVYAQVQKRNERNLHTGSVQNLSSPTKEQAPKMPEPSPRKRITQVKKKSAPVPPGYRHTYYGEDNISLASTTESTEPSTPLTPITPMTPSSLASTLEAEATINGTPLYSEINTAVKEKTEITKIVEFPKPARRQSVESLDVDEPIYSVPKLAPLAEGQRTTKETSPPPAPVPRPQPRVTTTATTTTTIINDVTVPNSTSTSTTTITSKIAETVDSAVPPQRAAPTPTELAPISTNVVTTPAELEATPTKAAHTTTDLKPTSPKSAIPIQPSIAILAAAPPQSSHSNITKVLLNRTPTPEPRSLSSEPPELLDRTQHLPVELTNGHHGSEEDDNVSKQADSGIGEPVPSPIPDSLPSDGSTHECKSTFESSSDDDDLIKTYNFKLGKTVVRQDHKTLDDLTVISGGSEVQSGTSTPITTTQATTPAVSETSSWNYAVPISPPPHFADGNRDDIAPQKEKIPDMPITPKIKARPKLNFEAYATERQQEEPSKVPQPEKQQELPAAVSKKWDPTRPQPATPLPSPNTPINEILDELSTIIQEKRMDTLIRRADEQPQIESAKPNTLSNFSITSISQHNTTYANIPTEARSTITSTKTVNSSTVPHPALEQVEQTPRKRNSLTNANQPRRSMTRADSFNTIHTSQTQTTTAQVDSPTVEYRNGLNSRSSSYLSLTKLEQNGFNPNRRRSSSELSIGESPSLQSLEVIKTILNARKNSNASNEGVKELRTTKSPQSVEVEAKLADQVVLRREVRQSVELRSEKHAEGIIKSVEISTEKFRQSVELNLSNNEESSLSNELKISSSNKVAQVVSPTMEADSSRQVETEMRNDMKPKQKENVIDDSPTKPKTEKLYRYTGPPSINFSTWSERPKVDVSIKNEGDYIFGGKQAGQQVNQAQTSNTQNPRVEHKYPQTADTTQHTFSWSPIKRMGIPEKREYRPPSISVKPLKDVVVENVPEKANENVINANTKVVVDSGKSAEPTVARRPITTAFSVATLPRSNINSGAQRMSYAKDTAIKETTAPTAVTTTTTKPSVTLLRSTSSTQPKSLPTPTAPTAAPFGQNTLRKTGFKEKMLAKEELETQKVNEVNQTVNGNQVYGQRVSSTTTISTNAGNAGQSRTTTITNSLQHQQPSKPLLQSSKLELKLQNCTSMPYNSNNNNNKAPPAPPKPKNNNNNIVVPPAPPPAPAHTPTPTSPVVHGFKSVSLKSASARSTANTPSPTNGDDPRDQLLVAIRNFKRDELKRT